MSQKLNPSFSSRIPIALSDVSTKIFYVDALPGVGKSYTAIHSVAVPHVRNKHNSILIYAVPTDRLKFEIFKEMIAAGIDEKLIWQTSSRDGAGRVQDQFRQLVVGENGKPGILNGSIILTTHECLARVPLDMRGRERCVVIYDEARACLQESYTLTLPTDVREYLTKPRNHPTSDGGNVHCSIMRGRKVFDYNDEKFFVVSWTNHRIDPPKDSASLVTKFSLTSAVEGQRLHDFMLSVRSSALDIYVSRASKKGTYVIRNVLSPVRMFRGYAKILILSAFFRTSQMYHFLINENLDGVDLAKNITQSFIDHDRVKALLRRLTNTYMTYVLDLEGRTLSKSDLCNAIVLSRQISDYRKKSWCKRWYDLHAGSRERTFASMCREWANSGNQPRTVGHQEREKFFDFFQDLHDVYGLRGGTVLSHMAWQASRLQRAFFDCFEMDSEPLLLGVNASLDARGYAHGAVWKDAGLDKLKNRLEQLPIAAHGLNAYQHCHSCAFLASMKYNLAEANLLRAISHGAYEPDVDRTLDYALQLLWRCNVRVDSPNKVLLIVSDRDLAKQLQRRFREAAGEWLSEQEAENLELDTGDMPVSSDTAEMKRILRVVAPEEINKQFVRTTLFHYSYMDTEEKRVQNKKYMKSEKGKLYREMRARYRDSLDGRKRKQLDDKISLYERKHGKNSAISARHERDKYMTLRQWRKSAEGRAEWKKLTESKGVP